MVAGCIMGRMAVQKYGKTEGSKFSERFFSHISWQLAFGFKCIYLKQMDMGWKLWWEFVNIQRTIWNFLNVTFYEIYIHCVTLEKYLKGEHLESVCIILFVHF